MRNSTKLILLLFFTAMSSLMFSHEDTHANEIKENKVTGWISNGPDEWYLYDVNGVMVTGWHGKYHFRNQDIQTLGRMDYGWFSENGKTYFFSTEHDGTFGMALTGWQWIDGYCYYFSKDGVLIANMPADASGDGTNEEGKWISNGVLQYIEGKGQTVKTSEVKGHKPSVAELPLDNSSEINRVPAKPTVSGNGTHDVSAAGSGSSSAATSSPARSPLEHTGSSKTTSANPAPYQGGLLSDAYLIDVLILQVKKDVPRSYVESIIKPHDGRIVKSFDSINSYVVKFGSISSLSKLEQLKHKLEGDTNVASVDFDVVHTVN